MLQISNFPFRSAHRSPRSLVLGLAFLGLGLPACDESSEPDGLAPAGDYNASTDIAFPDAGEDEGDGPPPGSDAAGDAGSDLNNFQPPEAGVPCDLDDQCDTGEFCASGSGMPECGSAGCCARMCDAASREGAAACGPTQECVAWYEEGVANPADAPDDMGACMNLE